MPRAGEIASFAVEIVARVLLFALVYAVAGVLALLLVWIATKFIHIAVWFTMGPHPAVSQLTSWYFVGLIILAGVSSAAAGAVVAIGSVLIRPLAGLLVLSLIAALVPVVYYMSLGPFALETVLYYLAGGAFTGLLGLLGVHAAGVLQPDRRLLQDFWRA